jgi:uncharacterized peroxidase-related enzyme
VLIAALAADHRTAALSDTERAMLDYVARLTIAPASVTRDDVDRLRANGLDDRGIHDLCAITAYYGFVNRIADGLGVQLEDWSGPPVPPA